MLELLFWVGGGGVRTSPARCLEVSICLQIFYFDKLKDTKNKHVFDADVKAKILLLFLGGGRMGGGGGGGVDNNRGVRVTPNTKQPRPQIKAHPNIFSPPCLRPRAR